MRKILGVFPKKPKTKESLDSSFKSTIQKAIDKEGGSVHLFRYDPENPGGLLAKISPFESDVKDWKDRDVESYLNQVHGGGRYRVRVDFKQADGTEREAKIFDFVLAGEPKEGYYESKKTKQAETQQVTEIFKTAMEFAKEVKGGDGGNAALIQALIQQNTALQTQNSQNMMEMQKQYNNLVLKISADKEAGGGMSEMIENMMHMEEFKSMLQPKVEQNETIELVRAIAPAIGTIMAGRMGIPQQEIKMIEASAPGAGDDINLGSPSPQTRETPSGSIKEATPSEIKEPEIQLPNGTKAKNDEFRNVVLVPLFEQIHAGVSPYEIAIFIKTILDFTMLRMKSNIEPHPALFGMVKSLVDASQGDIDLKSIEVAYNDFASDIEMPKELVEPVKQELMKIYMPTFLAMQKVADEEGEDADQTE